MNAHMTREAFEALPRRADLVNDPLPGQYYRDEMGGAVQARFDSGQPHNHHPTSWWAFNVTFTSTGAVAGHPRE